MPKTQRFTHAILWAIADSGNEAFIGDYCEAADNKTLSTLQKVGAAAMVF